MTGYSNRISLDFDGWTSWLKVIYASVRLWLREDMTYMTLYRSPSGKGLHVVAFLSSRITLEQQIQIREELFDDPIRIIYSKQDLKKGMLSDVLFTHKKIKGKWKKEKKILELTKRQRVEWS